MACESISAASAATFATHALFCYRSYATSVFHLCQQWHVNSFVRSADESWHL